MQKGMDKEGMAFIDLNYYNGVLPDVAFDKGDKTITKPRVVGKTLVIK